MEREDFYKEIGRHRKLVLILALNCYHCLGYHSFESASYFEAYGKIIGKSIKPTSTNVFITSMDLPLSEGQTEEGVKQMQRLGIFLMC